MNDGKWRSFACLDVVLGGGGQNPALSWQTKFLDYKEGKVPPAGFM